MNYELKIKEKYFMKTENEIKEEVTKKVVDKNRDQLKEELKQLEGQLEELYGTKIEDDVENSLEIAETGCTNTSARIKEQENKRFEQKLDDIKEKKKEIEKKLLTLDEFN